MEIMFVFFCEPLELCGEHAKPSNVNGVVYMVITIFSSVK